MRTIKFRAWDPEAKVMLMDVQDMYDGLGTYYDNHGKEVDVYKYFRTDSFGGILNSQEDGVAVMQFTGLLDKNGKEIYEGDIVRDGHYDSWIVRYQDSWASFVFQSPTDKGNYNSLDWLNSNDLRDKASSVFEIIGNIYEHPNLLK